MWQRFTERARRAVFFAQEEAQKFGERYVDTEHLLIGLMRDESSAAVRVLVQLGVNLDRVREEVMRHLPKVEHKSFQEMTLTPRVKRVIDLAYDEARELNHNYIGTEHLLLGLIREGEGLAGRLLAQFGVTIEAARSVVRSFSEEGRGAKRSTLSAFERAIVRLVWSLASSDPNLVREATRDLRAAGASRDQVVELCQLVAASSSEDLSSLTRVCEEVFDGSK